MGTKKASSRGTSAKIHKSKVNNRRIKIPEEDSSSDDSLLLDNDHLDLNRTISGWVPHYDDIDGLSEYIDQLKEMVFFPQLYLDFFNSYNTTPPRGILFCAPPPPPPGTGKTLIVNALAIAASKASQKVSFYMRMGANMLSKWVGEGKRQLKTIR
ncbi:hypothetical protein LguiA_022035 [Lonicera macranthoides]